MNDHAFFNLHPTRGVNHCESDFQHFDFCGELFNALSTLPLLFLSYWGLAKICRYASDDKHLKYTFISLGLVSVGSSISHIFLFEDSNFLLILDDLPLFVTLYLFWKVIAQSFPSSEDQQLPDSNLPHKHLILNTDPNSYLYKTNKFHIFIGTITFLAACAYVSTFTFCYQYVYFFYFGVYALLMLNVIYHSMLACYYGSLEVRELYLRFAMSCFVACLFWWLEELLCDDVGFIFFHPLWHLLLSYALYTWVIFALAFRGQVKEKFAQITWHFKGIIPCIVLID